jgi:hypothetical protein
MSIFGTGLTSAELNGLRGREGEKAGGL